jgi:hypothetical protein
VSWAARLRAEAGRPPGAAIGRLVRRRGQMPGGDLLAQGGERLQQRRAVALVPSEDQLGRGPDRARGAWSGRRARRSGRCRRRGDRCRCRLPPPRRSPRWPAAPTPRSSCATSPGATGPRDSRIAASKRSWARRPRRRTIGSMRALVHDPGATQGLRLGEAPDPEPGHADVVVEVAATSLNFVDVAFLRERVRPGAVTGHDARGRCSPRRPTAPGRRRAPGWRPSAGRARGRSGAPSIPASWRSSPTPSTSRPRRRSRWPG